jgi:hypothetical protein
VPLWKRFLFGQIKASGDLSFNCLRPPLTVVHARDEGQIPTQSAANVGQGNVTFPQKHQPSLAKRSWERLSLVEPRPASDTRPPSASVR